MQQGNSAEQLCNAVGLIIDRTRRTEVVLGQFCLTSKMRGVTSASTVFGYTEAPWALIVKFPHPDLTFGVKVVNLHPEFDKRQARLDYLAQANLGVGHQAVLENDIATVALDPVIQDLQPVPAGELNNALSLPLSVSSQDISGQMTGPDISQIIRKALASGREGLLTLFDERNFPFARLLIKPGHIQKVDYCGLYGEMGLFELLYRGPSGTFVFQPPGSYAWPEVRDITTPPETLGAEGTRRAGEMPGLLEQLGGKETRFVRAQESYIPGAVSPSLNWVAERLWAALDGYITLDHLWQRIGADTFTIQSTIQELVNSGLISRSTVNPFPRSGQLGRPVVPSQTADISVGHPLSGFYLDPLSARPVDITGSFVGVTRVQAPNQLLHTVPFPAQVSGGVIYSESNLLGINSGIFVPLSGQQVSPDQLYQMVFTGALNEMGTRRLRSAAANMEELIEEPGRPTREQARPVYDGEDEYPEDDGRSNLPQFPLPGGTTVSKKVVLIGAAALLLITVLLVMLGGPKKGAQTAVDGDQVEKVVEDPLAKTKEMALKYAGFKDKPLPTYEYVDTTEITKSQPSFGLDSETQDQKMLFLIWDNQGPLENLGLIGKQVPYVGVLPNPKAMEKPVDQGTSFIGGDPFNWICQRYLRTEDKKEEILLVGSFKSPEPGKAVVVIARAFNPENVLQHQTSLSVIDVMAANYSNQSLKDSEGKDSNKPADKSPVASAEEIDKYVAETVVPAVVGRFRPPDSSDEETEVKSQVLFRISDGGQVQKIEITEPSGNERYDKAVLKAIGSSYEKPPHTEEGDLAIQVTTSGADITVKRQ